MTRALGWVRKSKGDDDDIGLELQREEVPELAEELAEEYDILDLGIQTGFTTMSRDEHSDQLLDERDDVQNALDRLRAGEYDYIVAVDDRRICRDDYFSVIEYAANKGGAEFVYVDDVERDDLTFDLKRRIERDTKEEEIRKSKEAIEARKKRGYDHGRPRFGMTYDENGEYQVPDERFDDVLEILRMHAREKSYREIAEAVGVSPATAMRVVDRREWYIERSSDGKLTNRP